MRNGKARIDPKRCGFAITGKRSLAVHWSTDDGARLVLLANLGGAPDDAVALPQGNLVYTTGESAAQALASPWSASWLLASGSTQAIGDA